MKRMWGMPAAVALLALAACGGASEKDLAGNATNVQTTVGGPETSEPESLLGGSGTAAPRLTPGEWETSTDVTAMKMDGMPAGMPAGAMNNIKIPRTTVRTCLTPEDAANPKGNMLAAQKDRNCTIKSQDWSAGRMTVAMTCTGKDGAGTADIHMQGTFSGTGYALTGDMAMAGPNGMKMRMQTHTVGKRIGDCAS